MSVAAILGWHCISGFKVEDHKRSEVANNKSQIPVFIIIFDELQNDVLLKDEKISEKDFPNFARLPQIAPGSRMQQQIIRLRLILSLQYLPAG